MSRTDVHRPERVRQEDHLLRSEYRIYHDHRNGVCDTDPGPHWQLYVRWEPGTCYRHYVGVRQYCGCRLCTGFYWRRAERRRDRHTARLLIRTGAYDLL